MKLDPVTLDILAASRVEGAQLFLPPGQLDRPVYERVNKALENLGGKWNRKARAHLFPYDATEAVERALLTGEARSERTDFQCFYTPTPLAADLVRRADIRPDDLVLEPSAGEGALVRAVLTECPRARVIALEIREACKGWLCSLDVQEMRICDFLDAQPGFHVDRVVMNPPFTRQQDIDHVRHAYAWLKPGGRLVSVMSSGAMERTNRKAADFRAWVDALGGTLEPLPPDSFKASGTSVSACVLVLEAGG